MVSDVLSKAAKDLNGYLQNDTYKATYTGTTRTRLESLVREMEAIRGTLDINPMSGVEDVKPVEVEESTAGQALSGRGVSDKLKRQEREA